MTDRDYEQEARSQGWRPKEEFSGDPERWTDAQTFVEKGEKIAGILKSKVDRLEQRLTAAEMANKEFGEYTKTVREREKAASQQRIAELEAQLAQAVTDGDGQAFTKLNGEISRERASASNNVAPKNKSEYDQISQQWLSENQWYNDDVDLQIYADGLAERIVNEGYQGRAYFSELTNRVKARFPEKFGNPRKNGANGVENAGDIETKDSKQAHTYENLPAEAKAACKRFVDQGLMSKEEYLKSYEWE